MLIPKTAPYGFWKSPITSDLAAQSISNHQRYNCRRHQTLKLELVPVV
jgi:hypothetical protein